MVSCATTALGSDGVYLETYGCKALARVSSNGAGFLTMAQQVRLSFQNRTDRASGIQRGALGGGGGEAFPLTNDTRLSEV